MSFDLTHALMSLRPGAEWVLHGDSYYGLEWRDQQYEEPSKAELEAEIVRLQTAWDRDEYKRLRAAAYPDMRDYLDALVKGDMVQLQQYLDACLAVKAKYPKPE